jgi:hypothetical protein
MAAEHVFEVAAAEDQQPVETLGERRNVSAAGAVLLLRMLVDRDGPSVPHPPT